VPGVPATKRCRDCGVDRPLDEFPIQKGGRWGRHPLCKPCRAAQERRRYERDRDAILAKAKADPTRRERARWRAIERKYGLTRHAYELLYVAQKGCCAICDIRTDRLKVDHDHATGGVRGLLCERCNLGLGDFFDDAATCRAAAAYLLAR
jgi:hypothetical protein